VELKVRVVGRRAEQNAKYRLFAVGCPLHHIERKFVSAWEMPKRERIAKSRSCSDLFLSNNRQELRLAALALQIVSKTAARVGVLCNKFDFLKFNTFALQEKFEKTN